MLRQIGYGQQSSFDEEQRVYVFQGIFQPERFPSQPVLEREWQISQEPTQAKPARALSMISSSTAPSTIPSFTTVGIEQATIHEISTQALSIRHVFSGLATEQYLAEASPLLEVAARLADADALLRKIESPREVLARSLGIEDTSGTSAGSAESETIEARESGEIQYSARLLEAWDLDKSAAAILLGLEDVSEVRDVLRGITRLRRRDSKDRLRLLLAIDVVLYGLYRDEEVVRTWLREPQTELSGKSPLDLLLEGSMENMLRVKQFVEYLSGH